MAVLHTDKVRARARVRVRVRVRYCPAATHSVAAGRFAANAPAKSLCSIGLGLGLGLGREGGHLARELEHEVRAADRDAAQAGGQHAHLGRWVAQRADDLGAAVA